jgi:hypothetical protein
MAVGYGEEEGRYLLALTHNEGRHAGILVAVGRFLDRDVELAVVGARLLARVERAKGALFLGDLLDVTFAMARWEAIPPPYEDLLFSSLCERVRPKAVLAFCRRLEERYQALERYAPPESVFLSLFLNIGRLANA